ncbi:MAG: NUDIX domain-containing protein [Candidatus Paceibacterota bacterium]
MPEETKDKIIFLKDKVLHQSAGGFVFFESADHVLYVALLKTKPGKFVIPKGHLKVGEGAAGAALREIKEELGINIRLNIIDKIGESRYQFKKHNDEKTHFKKVNIFVMYVKKRVNLVPEVGGGVGGAEWLRAEDALKKIAFDKPLLLKAIATYYSHFYLPRTNSQS